jgi:hypothetical protein|tara:strand:- start:933 stop:1238 length:306 start_codon:yes stop_codon:yes gene_type:complete
MLGIAEEASKNELMIKIKASPILSICGSNHLPSNVVLEILATSPSSASRKLKSQSENTDRRTVNKDLSTKIVRPAKTDMKTSREKVIILALIRRNLKQGAI